MTKENEEKQHRPARSLIEVLALAFFGLSALVLLISSGLQLIANIQTQQLVILNKQQLIAQEASKTVSSFFDDKFTSLEATVELIDLSTVSAEQKKTILNSVLGFQPAFRQIILLSATGTEAAQASRVSYEVSNQFREQVQSDLPMLTQMEKDQRYASQIYIDEVSSEPLVTLAIPVTNILGDFKGTLVAELNLKFMWNLVDQLKTYHRRYGINLRFYSPPGTFSISFK